MYVFIERGVPDGHVYDFRDAADAYINVRPGEIKVKVK
jgi:hypothetical protein